MIVELFVLMTILTIVLAIVACLTAKSMNSFVSEEKQEFSDFFERKPARRLARDYRIVADPIGSTSSVHRKFRGRKR